MPYIWAWPSNRNSTLPPEEQHVPEEAERQMHPFVFLEEIPENCSIERASRVACLCFPSIVRDATTVPDL